MIITQIKQAIKNPDRVNLYLDDEFWIGLDKNELLEFKLFKGKELNFEEKEKIQNSSVITKLYSKAINYIQIRPRSEKELRDYFKKKDADVSKVELVIKKLKEKKYLSDEEFAEWLIKGRLMSGKYGENRIKNELYKKGINKDIIQTSLSKIIDSEIGDEMFENAKTFALKAQKSIKAKDKYEFKNKLIRKILARGYSFSIAKKVIDQIGGI